MNSIKIWAPTALTQVQEFEYIQNVLKLLYEGQPACVNIHHPSETIDCLIGTGLSDFDYELDTIRSDQWFTIYIKPYDNSRPKYSIHCHSIVMGLCTAYLYLRENYA